MIVWIERESALNAPEVTQSGIYSMNVLDTEVDLNCGV
jgi:hypothetical protein